MSNAKKKDAQRQIRRQRALSRFTTRPRRADEGPEAYEAYLQRKQQEIAALERHLGAQS